MQGVVNVRDSEFLALVGWLAGGAALGSLAGWAVAAAVGAIGTPTGVGVGFAVGGGLGTVLKLIVADEEGRTPESMTVSMDGEEGPQPADLFEIHPDPVLYYVDEGRGPVVRAANDAFAETFGVPASAVENAALGDALMVVRGEDVVDAAADGSAFDGVLPSEADGSEAYRVRVAAVSGGAKTSGYVLYSPAE